MSVERSRPRADMPDQMESITIWAITTGMRRD
jgi:hypothetical protein